LNHQRDAKGFIGWRCEVMGILNPDEDALGAKSFHWENIGNLKS
jgi:hypothetical protein